MNKTSKSFLRNALLMTVADIVIILFMQEWGVAQVIIVLLVTLLAAGQWALWLYMRKGR
ncbi:MAG: hypothetical protein IJO91_02690 [Oscillospiraceae bacterium]|nr:hypothetical protein [Oscillospiraceae bacterium]